jgi:hypothetical protein
MGSALSLDYDLPELDALLTEMANEDLARGTLERLPANWKVVKTLPWQLRTNDAGSATSLR